MKRLLAVALIALVAACSNGPKSGTVVDRGHQDAYSYWIAGIYIPGSCTMIGKVESCTSGMHIPGHMQYVPESWSLKLDPHNDGKHVGWRDVSEDTYAACAERSFYPDCKP